MALDIEDHARLAEWLVRHGHARSTGEVRCRTLAGGVSNKTVWVEVRPAGDVPGSHGEGEGRWVLKQALAKLRVKDDWHSDVSRIRREAEALRVLPELTPEGSTTPLVFEAPEENLLAMQAVPEPHENLKALLMAGTRSREPVLELAHELGLLLGSIQWRSRAWVPTRDVGDLKARFADRSFFESLRVGPYYETAADREPGSAAFYRSLIDDTRREAETGGCLVHGDFSPKNVLVRGAELVLLDHEVIHWGDGAFDVGFCLTHLLSKAHHVQARRDDYAEAARRFVLGVRHRNVLDEGRCVRHALGCLLARVIGKSPLEYLTGEERMRQGAVVLGLMRDPPPTVDALTRSFIEGIRS